MKRLSGGQRFLLGHLLLAFVLGSSSNPLASTRNDNQIAFDIDARLNQQRIQQWLQWQSRALTQAMGELPAKPFNVRVRASTPPTSTVPWGQVQRLPRENRVTLVVNPSASLQQLNADWTAYHEYSHLLIPYRGYGDLWFSEGLASYYQNVTQYRVGELTAGQARDRLIAGLKRGIHKNPAPQLTLTQLSREMSRYRAYMRVYWSGAWYFFQVDQQLRERGKTLDQALLALNHCCSHQAMSAEEMVFRLDQITNTSLFSDNFYALQASKTLVISSRTLEQMHSMTWPRKLYDSKTYLQQGIQD